MSQYSAVPLATITYLTKNGGELFRRSLTEVLAQEVDFKFEVVVVDSGSTDGTLEYLRDQPVRFYQIAPGEFNFGLTRDYAFSLAAGEILVTLSQDAIPVGKNWLRDMVEPFAYAALAVVQGCEATPVDRDVFYWEEIGMFYQTRDCRKWNEQHNGIGMSFTNCAIRRSVWRENQMGRVEMSEDRVFQRAIAGKGGKIFPQWTAQVYHAHDYPTVNALAKRCENEGMGHRYVANCYSLRDMLFDLFRPSAIYFWLRGVLTGQITSLPEMLFPMIRPLFVYKGNHFSRYYIG